MNTPSSSTPVPDALLSRENSTRPGPRRMNALCWAMLFLAAICGLSTIITLMFVLDGHTDCAKWLLLVLPCIAAAMGFRKCYPRD